MYLNLKEVFFRWKVIPLFLLLFWPTPLIFSQKGGFKYLKNYSPPEYDSHPQNWCILQDRHGIIYVGNQGGLLEFDGISWRLIHVPNDSVRSLAVHENGTIYIGGINEIGYLASGAKGVPEYVSLLGHLEENQRNFSYVWRTHATKEEICFRTSKFLFLWNPGSHRMTDLVTPYTFNASFVCGEKLYIHHRDVGLTHIANGSIKMVPGGEVFKNLKIYMMVPYGPTHSQQVLIGTREKGFYLFHLTTGEARPFPTEVDNALKDKELYHGIELISSPGQYALATLQGGLFIMDAQGRLKETFDLAYGLQNEQVTYVFEDIQGNLWLAMDEGISRIEYNSPISVYDNRSRLPGMVSSVIKHQGQLYAGTSTGLCYLESSGHTFIPVKGITSRCWSLLSFGNFLWAATTYGVFQLEKNNPQNLHHLISESSYVLLRSQVNANRVWVGTERGLLALDLSKKPSPESPGPEKLTFENITEEIRTIIEDKKGNLWLGTLTKGVLKVRFPTPGKLNKPEVKRYSSPEELPPGEVHVFMAANRVMFATGKGLFGYDEKEDRFHSDSTLGKEFADGNLGVFRMAEDQHKNVWLHTAELKNIQALLQKDGSFVLNKKPFLRIPPAQVNMIYPDPDGDTVWFAGHDGLIRYDAAVKKNYRHDFQALIRKVWINSRLHFDGHVHDKIKPTPKSSLLFPIINYKDRNLRFEFAAPSFEGESPTRFQYFLEGYDKDWSPLSAEKQKDYNNLASKMYTFRVRARDVYGNLSREADFPFRVLPPWYKSWWAISLYAAAFFFLVFFIVKWRSWKLELEKQRLEQIIKDRTREINQKNRQLERQTLQLQEQSEQLKEMDKVKSRFFANLSHEFRTPLTLIMGPLEQMLSAAPDKRQRKPLNMMLRNSQRLLTLINQLLDLSKFDSGTMRLQANLQNLIPFLKGITASFEALAAQKKLELQFSAEEENIQLYFDPGKVEQIMGNLLLNAVKFTPPGGKITVEVRKVLEKEGEPPSSPGFLEIGISDTGIGIPEEHLGHIFDRFYQVENLTYPSGGYDHEGTGIGLALARELIHLHHGTIEVRSVEGKGTEFLIRLPLGKEHLHANEIATSPGPRDWQKTWEIAAPYLADKEEKKKADLDEPINRVHPAGDNTDTDKDPEPREKTTILVVDDSASVREYIRGSLESDYAVVEAANGLEGIQKSLEIIPDLIISDILMPGADGYELCNRLKHDIKTSHIPIILLTAKASEENILHGLETGADDYITKPFNTKILCARIKNLIELRRQWQLKMQRQKNLLPAEISVSSMDEEFLNEFQGIVEKNLTDPDFNIGQLCKKLYMGRTSLFRKIEALTGETPNQFIQSYRLHRAAQLLKANFGNITQVALEVGFSSSAYFTKCFKEKFHQLPSTFQAAESELPPGGGGSHQAKFPNR